VVEENRPEYSDDDSDTSEEDDTGCARGRSGYMLPRRKLTRVEELEWIRPLLEKLWPKIDLALHKIMKEVVEPKIQDKVPFALKGLTFTKFTLGKTLPTVGPITIWDAPCLKSQEYHRGLELHIKVKLDTKNVDVELAIGALTAGVKSCSLEGTLVLRLDPLLDVSPILGGLVIYFLDPPKMDLNFTQLANLAETEFTAGRLTQIVEKLVAQRLVLPNVWFKPFLQNEDIVDTATLRDPKPVGVLRVTAIEAKQLYGSDFHLFKKPTSDPYVRIRLADVEWTSGYKEETCNPRWLPDPEMTEEMALEEVQHDFLVYDVGQQLQIEVYDWNQLIDHVLIGRSDLISVQEALSCSRKPLMLSDATGKTKRGQLHLQFDWLKLTQESQEGDCTCMVRIKIDEVYVPDDIDLTWAKVQVKLKDGRMRQTPATFPAAAVDPTLSENFPSEKRLDVEYVMCFNLLTEVALAEPLEISLVSQNNVAVGIGIIKLDEVMKRPEKTMECTSEPMELERPDDSSVISDFLITREKSDTKAPPVRAEVTISVMGLQPVSTKAALTHMRKRCQLLPEDMRTPSHSTSTSRFGFNLQPPLCRDTTKCTGSVESLDWFNAFFARLWPKIATFVQRLMEDQDGSVTQKMQAAVPSLLKGIHFSKFKLGIKTPVFGPIKISEAPERWGKDGKDIMQGSEIRLGVKLDSDSEIELSVMGIKVGIHRLQVRGEIAIRFEPLLAQTPVIGGLVLCFLNPPKLAMEYKHFAQIVSSNPVLDPLVKSAIDRAICKALVMPNVISIPIGTEEKGVDRALLRHPRPLGLLRIKAKTAQGLPDGHLHVFSKHISAPYLRVRVADDEWYSSASEGNNPVWKEEDTHCFWYYDARQTIHIDVLDRGRFNKMHTLGVAKPMLVKDACDKSGAPIELFAPVAGLDEVSEESCGLLELECELLQPRPGLRPACELCMLRLKLDEVYVPEGFPQPVALRARCSDSEKNTPFVLPKVVKVDTKKSKSEPNLPTLKRLGTVLPEDEIKQPITLEVEYVLHLLIKKEELNAHQLELELIDRKRNVLATKEVELKQLVDRKSFRRVWGSEKQPLLNLRGQNGKCQVEIEVQISGLDPQQARVGRARAPPRINPLFVDRLPRCWCSLCRLKRESWYLLAFSGNALIEGAACLIGSLSGFLLIFIMTMFGPRHKHQSLPKEEAEAGDAEEEARAVPPTLYEGGDTTRSSKEKASPHDRQPSTAEPRSPTASFLLNAARSARAASGSPQQTDLTSPSSRGKTSGDRARFHTFAQ